MAPEFAFRQVVDRLPCGVVGVDAHGFVQFVNTAAANLLGVVPADLAGRHVKQVLRVFRPDSAELVNVDELREATPNSEQVQGPFLLLDGAGRERYVSLGCVRDREAPDQMFVTLIDETSTMHSRTRLENLVKSDPVTGLAHKLQLQSHLLNVQHQSDDEAWLVHVRFFSRAFLLQPGDALLTVLSQRAQEMCAPCEIAARVGDHMIAILKRSTASSINALGATLLRHTSDYRFAWGTSTFETEAGVALVPARTNSCDPWFLAAAGYLFCTDDSANKVRLVTDAELREAYRLTADNRDA
jgi:PAS domain S-box-containing protein